ncbi:hypothetical protein IJT17_09870, partial [bacterium]|nr:hypothetical protein [bacterium]
ASGKSTFLHNTSFQSKVFDVDAFKKAYNTAIRVKQLHPEWVAHDFTKGGNRLRDLRDPQDSDELHNFIKDAKFSERQRDLFFSNLTGILPNVTFDITGSDSFKLEQLFKSLKQIGLKSDNGQQTYRTSLCVIVTNRDLAILNNLSRSRIVPEKEFHRTHDGVANGIVKFLKHDAVNVDEAWIYFSPQNDDKLARENPALALWIKDNRYIRLEKRGNGFKITEALEKKLYRILGDTAGSVDYIPFDELLSQGIRDKGPQGKKMRDSIKRGETALHRKSSNTCSWRKH